MGSDYGKLVRSQFADVEGNSELAMLVVPSREELAELEKAVAIMTPEEKTNADKLSDEQIQKIAADAKVDPANLAIFFNGYAMKMQTGLDSKVGLCPHPTKNEVRLEKLC